MCRTCRHIDPSPSFVFIGPPPSRRLPPGRWRPDEGSPGRRSRLSVTLTGRRLPPPKRSVPSQRPAGTPSARPPPSDRPAPGGTPGHPRHGISSAKKRKCWLWGLKNRPPKIDESSIFAPKGAPFIFGQVLKKSRRSNEYFERYSQKTWGEGRICPPPPSLSSARVKVLWCGDVFCVDLVQFCEFVYGASRLKPSPGRIFPELYYTSGTSIWLTLWLVNFSQSEAEDSGWLSGTGERYVQLLSVAHGGRSGVTNVVWGSVMLCASTVSRRVRRTWQSDAQQ